MPSNGCSATCRARRGESGRWSQSASLKVEDAVLRSDLASVVELLNWETEDPDEVLVLEEVRVEHAEDERSMGGNPLLRECRRSLTSTW